MPNNERGIIKWRSFESVTPHQSMIKDLLKKRSKIKMPILSEEQKNNLESKLIIAFYSNDRVKISYFNNGEILNFEDYIKKIDSIYHKIYFYNHILLFDQIVEVL